MKMSHVLRINNQGDLSSLHPHYGVDLNCRTFQKALFEGLTRHGPDGTIALAGAEKVEISPSQTTYTFTLRPMLWTNGERVTAEHFASSWRAILMPESPCPRADLLYLIKNAKQVKRGMLPVESLGIDAKDDRTLIVELEHPAPYFLDLVANALFSPLYDLSSKLPTHFNGPFTLASWEHENLLVLEKNPDYWDAANVRLEKIQVSLVRDPHSALMMYEKGELDWMGHPFTLLPQDSIVHLESTPDYISSAISATYWLSCNTQSFPLNVPQIRKALSMAIDRKMIAQHIFMDEIPSKGLIPATIALINHKSIDVDIERAKELFLQGLEELNLTTEQFPVIRFNYSDVPGQKKMAELLQQTWEQTFGIKVELVGSDWNTFFSTLGERRHQIGGCIWYSLFNDPMYLLEFFKYQTNKYNNCQWENESYQDFLELASHETESELRKGYLSKAEEILLEEMPVIPLYSVKAKYVKSPNLKGVTVNSLGGVDFRWGYFE